MKLIKWMFDGNIPIYLPEVVKPKKLVKNMDRPYHTKGPLTRQAEISKKMRCIKMICGYINADARQMKSMIDVMAGVGLSASMYIRELGLKYVSAIEIDNDTFNILMHNLPYARLLKMDANKLEWTDEIKWNYKLVDIVLLDFNSFTLNHYAMWKGLLDKAAEHGRWVLVTDVSSFNRKFLPAEERKKAERDYIDEMQITFFKNHGLVIELICGYGNAEMYVFKKGLASKKFAHVKIKYGITPIFKKKGLL